MVTINPRFIFVLVFICINIICVNGQIILDGTLGPAATLDGPDFSITDDLGTTVGTNLFHSFGEFNINTGESATFSGPDAISNVFSRVTGGNPSNIDGLLRSTISDANLFFLNPSGVMFGPNARLDVNGSFVVSTADYLKLGDNGRFDATQPENTVLTSAPVEAFGFLTNNPSNLTLNGSTLKVSNDQTLSIIGGDVQMTGGQIEGASGDVNIVSTGSEGEIAFDGLAHDSEIGVDSFEVLGEIAISANSEIELKDSGGVRIVGKGLTIDDSSISTKTIGDIAGRDINIQLTGNLEVIDGAQISTTTFGIGSGGNIFVVADLVVIKGMNTEVLTGFSTDSTTNKIEDLEVTVDMTHTRVSDLIMALFSPNGTRVDLVNGVGGDGDNFENTAFDDEASGPIQSASAPFSGSFQPLGELSDTDGESPNGAWALVIVDRFEGEDGTLNNWSVTLDTSITGPEVFQTSDVPHSIDHTSQVVSNLPVTVEGGGGEGAGGRIDISANTIDIVNGELSATADAIGDSGAIRLQAAESISIAEDSILKVNSLAANGGGINVTAGSTLDLIRSEITSEIAGNGGNISVVAENMDRFSTDISTQVAGEGGEITINPVPSGEIELDGSFGAEGPLSGPDYIVSEDMGLTAEGNLFHSFAQFDIAFDESVTFTGVNSIENILARVTGDNPSIIDGTISSTIPDVNIFLMNPMGILFGLGAQLDLSGSFVATTGDYIKVGDNGRFDVADPDNSLFTSGLPSTFGFSRSEPETLSFLNSNLLLHENMTVSLIGGNIQMKGAQLTVPNGDLTIVSVASKGEVIVNNTNPETPLEISSFSKLGDIKLTNNANIDVSGDGGGQIVVNGKNLIVISSTILSETLGEGAGGMIEINLIGNGDLDGGELQLINGGQISTSTLGIGDGGTLRITAESVLIDKQNSQSDELTGLAALTLLNESGGRGGNIILNAGKLCVVNGGQIETSTRGSGHGGALKVTTDSLHIDGKNSTTNTGFFAETQSAGGGMGGDIIVNTGELRILDGGRLDVRTRGSGAGGMLSVTADSIFIDNRNSTSLTGMLALTRLENGGGKAGTIVIDSDAIQVVNGGEISAVTRGDGDAGTIRVTGGSIFIDPQESPFFTGITVQSPIFAENGKTGDSGDIIIDVEEIDIFNGGLIDALTFGRGNGGTLMITAKRILIDDQDSPVATGISAGSIFANEGGKGGDIFINATDLRVVNGGLIDTETSGRTGGNITIVSNSIILDNMDSGNFTGISARSSGSGNGGNIDIKETNHIFLKNGAQITVFSPGGGDAGGIRINAIDSIILTESSIVSAQSANNAGNVLLNAGNRVLIEQDSKITTQAGFDGGDIQIQAPSLIQITRSEVTAEAGNNGGNITIDPVHTILDNSRISANAINGDGGNISIVTEAFIASGDSTISASSEFGLSGNVDVFAPDIDIAGSLAVLPGLLDVSALQLQPSCAVRLPGDFSTFKVKSKDGVLIPPDDFLPSY